MINLKNNQSMFIDKVRFFSRFRQQQPQLLPLQPKLHFIRQSTQRFVLLVEDTAVMNVQVWVILGLLHPVVSPLWISL